MALDGFGMTATSVKIMWGALEIVGRSENALFSVKADTSIDIPSSSRFVKELTATSNGTIGIEKINEDSREFNIQISGVSRDGAIELIRDEFRKGGNYPLIITSLLDSNLGEVIQRYDNAVLAKPPQVEQLSNDYPVYMLPFSVGFDKSIEEA